MMRTSGLDECGLPLRWMAVVVGLGLLGGCQFKGGPIAGAPAREKGGEQAVWEVRPTSMRIYPSSGFRVIGGQSALEARIELFDDMGDSIKGVGTVRFELYPQLRPERSDVGARLFAWEIEMLTREDNALRYDAVTRSYAFQLHMPRPPEPGKALRLVGQFEDAHSGERLSAEAVVSPES